MIVEISYLLKLNKKLEIILKIKFIRCDSRNVRLSEAPSHGVPVLIYDKNCPGSKSYYNFTDEFIVQENKIGSAA